MHNDNDVEALGITSTGYEYMRVLPSQEEWHQRIKEFFKIRDFLLDIIDSNQIKEFQGENRRIQFINYGDTQLVYVLTVGNRKYTLLVGQPATEFGAVKKEYENLRLLGRNNSENIVMPIKYCADERNHKELYVTPYLYQSRCIGIEDTEWGMWIPEPEYHFQEFSQELRSIINSCMIAILIKCFDDKNNLGIGACRLDGGDFMLEKGFEDKKITYENILKRMKLISARELLPMTLDEYVYKIEEEFSKSKTENFKEKLKLINHKGKAYMTVEEIHKGIELGYKLREKQKEQDER